LADGGGGRGNVLHCVKREGELSGRWNVRGICPGNMSRVGNVQIPCELDISPTVGKYYAQLNDTVAVL